MTQSEWVAATHPSRMLDFLRRKASARKLRLFAAACARRVLHISTAPEGLRAIETAERHADGRASARELATAMRAAPPGHTPRACARTAALSAAKESAHKAAYAIAWFTPTSISGRVANWDPEREALLSGERAAQCRLLQEIFGPLPFRSIHLDPSWLLWNSGTVKRLAASAYEERSMPEGTLDVACLKVLADALEEAGCTDVELLGHLRGPGPHVRGCWLVDLLLDQS